MPEQICETAASSRFYYKENYNDDKVRVDSFKTCAFELALQELQFTKLSPVCTSHLQTLDFHYCPGAQI